MKKYAVAIHYLQSGEIVCEIAKAGNKEIAMIKAVEDDGIDFVIGNIEQAYGVFSINNVKQYYFDGDIMVSEPMEIVE